MKEIIIVAGADDIEINELREHLKEHGYHSIRCHTLRGLIDELQILPICSLDVILIVITPGMLRNPCADLINELSECAADIPFILSNKFNTLLSVEGHSSEPIQHIISAEFKLSENILRASA